VPEDTDWPSNYFNYFTEVEEHFQKVRGTSLFLLSPLDWALIEAWKNAGIPLEAVLRGIDQAFAKRRRRIENINSVAFCTQAVMAEAQAMAGAAPAGALKPVEAPFTLDELKDFLSMNVLDLRKRNAPAYESVAGALEKLYADAEQHYQRLEDLEQRLTALEDKMIAVSRATQSDEDLATARKQLDSQLRPYRGKMTAEQLTMLEKHYLDRYALESAGLPRLSLFYLR
jgi:hypothetical protein